MKKRRWVAAGSHRHGWVGRAAWGGCCGGRGGRAEATSCSGSLRWQRREVKLGLQASLPLPQLMQGGMAGGSVALGGATQCPNPPNTPHPPLPLHPPLSPFHFLPPPPCRAAPPPTRWAPRLSAYPLCSPSCLPALCALRAASPPRTGRSGAAPTDQLAAVTYTCGAALLLARACPSALMRRLRGARWPVHAGRPMALAPGMVWLFYR